MVDFSKLKKRSENSLERLNNAVAKEQQAGFQKDDRYWSLSLDKAGNGSAVIRFLPVSPKDLEIDEDALPYVKTFRHGFQGPGGWYIEDSLTTINKPDPVSEYNTKEWNKGDEDSKNRARARKRKLTYVANIEVISDPNAPENEGKVKLYRFGKKIFEKIMAAKDGDEDTPGIDVFDFWRGANFRLKAKTITVDNKKMPNYDDSKFAPPTPHQGGDEKKLKAIWEQQYSLKELIDPSNFKSYDELKARLFKVLGIDADGEVVAPRVTAESVNATVKPVAAPKTVNKKEVDVPWETSPAPSEEEEDDSLAYFRKLAEED